MPRPFRRRPVRHSMPPVGEAARAAAAPPQSLEGWTQAIHATLTGLGHDMAWRITEIAHTGACRDCGGQVVDPAPPRRRPDPPVPRRPRPDRPQRPLVPVQGAAMTSPAARHQPRPHQRGRGTPPQERRPDMTPTTGTAAQGACGTCNGFRYILVTHYFTRESHLETCTSCGATGRRKRLPRWLRPFSGRARSAAPPLSIDGISYRIHPADEAGRGPIGILGLPWLAVIAAQPGGGSQVIAGWITTGPSPWQYGAYTGGGSRGPALAVRDGGPTPGTALRTVAACYAGWLRQQVRR